MALAASRRNDCIGKLCNPSLKTNLPKFLNSCVLRVDPLTKLTDHVIQAVSNDVYTHLWQNRLNRAKCSHVESEAGDEEEEVEDPSPDADDA